MYVYVEIKDGRKKEGGGGEGEKEGRKDGRRRRKQAGKTDGGRIKQ